ncbi:MAG TPA: DUF5667 domain-containing protein [Candidatus Paceibacterota bacterium]|jgi:hypothetical protein|nr:DUF5667 domain-containing protein [Candidatus Paceibacterota bacterium]
MDKLTNIQNEAHKLRMTPAEKTAMKALLRKYYEGPARPISSPYFSFFALRSFSGVGTYQFLHARVLAPLAVLLVVFAGAGTAAAAQGSLPGDLLYPVKVSINESIEVALATTPVAKAEVSAKLAERRVEEAETLAARGDLDTQTGQALAANFEAHAQSAQDSADTVATDDPAAAAQLRTNLDSSLSAHGAILATLSGGTTENKEATDVVATAVLARADSGTPVALGASLAKTAGSANQAMTMSVSVASSAEATDTASLGDAAIKNEENPKQEAAAIKIQVRAAQELVDAREQFEAGKDKLDDTSITQVSGEFVEIDTLMDEGSTTLAVNDYAGATAKFNEALKLSIKLEVLLRAQSKLDRNIITPVLDQENEDDGDSTGGAHILPAVLNAH